MQPSERVAQNARHYVDNDGRTQKEIASEAWPHLLPLQAERKLQAVLSGKRWPTEPVVEALIAVFNIELGALFE